MSFVAEASIDSTEAPATLFDRLADHGEWFRFMPRSFRPMGGARGLLRAGDTIKVRIGGLPSPLRIVTVDRPREIAWTGGRRGVLYAEHRFLFEPTATGTTVRSVETWEGALTPFLKPLLKRLAERVGAQQLRALAKR